MSSRLDPADHASLLLIIAVDNVVRAGLTPKLRDVDTLISMLTYVSAPADAQLLTTSSFAPKTELYDPPIDEFSVLRTSLDQGETEKHRPIEGPSITIVTEGKGRVGDVEVQRGDVVFIAAEVEVEFESSKEGEGSFTFFRAFVEA
jgi:mannose-6-phosphate isomerase